MSYASTKHRQEYLEGRSAFASSPEFINFKGLNRCPYVSSNGGSDNGRRVAWMDGWLQERFEQKYTIGMRNTR